MCLAACSLCSLVAKAQDLPRIKSGSYWLPAVREVPFVSSKFPIVLEPDPKGHTGCYIAIPIQRVQKKGCQAKFKLFVEEWDVLPEIDEGNSYEVGMRKKHVSLVMQRNKTGTPSGFCASARRLPIGKPCDTSLTYSSKPPDSFYVTMHVPYWVKRVTILSFKVEGHQLIERVAPATAEQKQTMATWIDKLAAENYAARQAAHDSLVGSGQAAVPILTAYKLDEDPERRTRVCEILAEIERVSRKRMPPVKMATPR